jgi:hypothetical protein
MAIGNGCRWKFCLAGIDAVEVCKMVALTNPIFLGSTVSKG